MGENPLKQPKSLVLVWEPSVAVASPAQCRAEPVWRLCHTRNQGQVQLLRHVLHLEVLGWRVEVRERQRW